MITYLTKGCWNILKLFYYDKTAVFHFREISRLSKMHEPSTMRALKILKIENLLKFEKEGNMNRYSIKHNPLLYATFTLFDIEKYERLPAIKKSAIACYTNKLKEQPVFMILFGSTAKETYKENSDIDLLLVTNNKINTKEAEKEADSIAGTKISTFQISYNLFLNELKLKQDPVIQSAIKTGYPLKNHIDYYGVLFNERI